MDKQFNQETPRVSDGASVAAEPMASSVGASAESAPPLSSASRARQGEGANAALDLRETVLRRVEAEGLINFYPDFDLDAALTHPTLGALLRGEVQPTIRQLYEATHMEAIVEARVQSRLDSEVARALADAIPAAVSAAVAESEERLLGHIRARGQRPSENGMAASVGIRMHPAVDRLTRRERAILAERAGRGETVRL